MTLILHNASRVLHYCPVLHSWPLPSLSSRVQVSKPHVLNEVSLSVRIRSTSVPIHQHLFLPTYELRSPLSRCYSISIHRVPMDFTEIYGQSAGLVAFSPGAHFILTAVQDRVIIRRADSFQIARTWHADVDTPQSSTNIALPTKIAAGGSQGGGGQNVITHAGWSSDSEYILAACAKKGTVTVFKLRDETWNARIDAGAEGLVKAEWAPDGRTILIFSSWGVGLSHFDKVPASLTWCFSYG